MAHAGMEFLSNNYGLAGLTNGVWQSNHDYSIDFAVEGGGWCDNTTQSYEIRLRGVQNPFGVVVNLYPGGPNAPRPWQSLRGQYVAVEYGFNVYDYQPTTYGGGTFIVEMRKQGTTGPVVTSSWYSEAYIYFV